MLPYKKIQPPILPHNAFRVPIHLVALLYSALPAPTLLLPPSTSVTAALRPGSR